MTVAHILKDKGNKVISVSTEATVMQALEILGEHRIGAVVVLAEEGALAGVLSERDVARGLPQHGAGLLDQPVTVLMSRDVITCEPSATMKELMETMTRHRIRHLPVLDGGDLVGVVTIGDVVKQRIAETQNKADALISYITTG